MERLGLVPSTPPPSIPPPSQRTAKRTILPRPQPEQLTSSSSSPSSSSGLFRCFKDRRCEYCPGAAGSPCVGGYSQALPATPECRPAICGRGCGRMALARDGCPLCACGGYGTREPCSSLSDCGAGALACAAEALCRYPPPPPQPRPPPPPRRIRIATPSLPSPPPVPSPTPNTRWCSHFSQCPGNSPCVQGRCWTQQPSRASSRQRLPASFQGRRGSLGGGPRISGMATSSRASLGVEAFTRSRRRRRCQFTHQCPSRFFCHNAVCRPGGPSHSSKSCNLGGSGGGCGPGEACVDLSCVSLVSITSNFRRRHRLN